MTVRILNDKIVVFVDLANPPASAAGLDIALSKPLEQRLLQKTGRESLRSAWESQIGSGQNRRRV